MARKRADNLLAAKERRKKKIAIVGAVLLVAVLAIQLPRTLKMLNRPSGSSPAEAQAVDEETRTPTTPPPAVTAPAADPVAEAAAVETGRLVSFTRFERKDPFRPQIRDDAAPSDSTASESAAPAKSKPQARPEPKRPRVTKADQRLKLVRAPVRAAPKRTIATSAVISVNGASEEVDVGSAFPESQKLFRLASLGPYGAKIGVAGGSLVGGRNTVTLERGKALTLENTASGQRYRLRLVSVS